MSIVTVVEGAGLFVTISKKKWKKVQSILQKWRDKIRTGSEFEINLKELERNVGFLVQISVAFQSMKPFLRGFYLTSNSWREDRSSEGWKMP